MFPSITDVLGVLVGHATDEKGGTGWRELDACRPESLAGRVDAIVLCGGSAYGLAAADGVMRWLESRKRGFAVGPGVIPIVPAAVIFDLMPCGVFDARPTAEMGLQACGAAQTFVTE